MGTSTSAADSEHSLWYVDSREEPGHVRAPIISWGHSLAWMVHETIPNTSRQGSSLGGPVALYSLFASAHDNRERIIPSHVKLIIQNSAPSQQIQSSTRSRIR